MKMPKFAYHRPDTVDEALELLDRHDAKVLAGGQSLVALMSMRIGQPEHLIDIGNLHDLHFIKKRQSGVAIGALVRHAEAESSPLVTERAPMVAAAMPHVGHQAIRNRGTICGSLAHADPAAELPAVAVATGARFVARSVNGERVIEANDFFEGYLETALEPNELLTEVRFPAWPEGAGASVTELSRRHGDFAIIGLAAKVLVDPESDLVNEAALVFFGAGSLPVRIADAETSLVGQPASPDSFATAAAIVADQLDPTADNHGTAAYRKHTAGVLTKRGLAEAVATIGAPA
jgi:carbon-monoxide dehydrogenase medium subunit